MFYCVLSSPHWGIRLLSLRAMYFYINTVRFVENLLALINSCVLLVNLIFDAAHSLELFEKDAFSQKTDKSYLFLFA